MIEANQIDRIVPVSDPEVRRILGIEYYDDPDQAARRMVRNGVPHLRIGRRIRFSIPALQKWAADRLAASLAPGGAKNKEGANVVESLTTTSTVRA